MPGENGSGIPPTIKPWRPDHYPMPGENGSGIPPTDYPGPGSPDDQYSILLTLSGNYREIASRKQQFLEQCTAVLHRWGNAECVDVGPGRWGSLLETSNNSRRHNRTNKRDRRANKRKDRANKSKHPGHHSTIEVTVSGSYDDIRKTRGGLSMRLSRKKEFRVAGFPPMSVRKITSIAQPDDIPTMKPWRRDHHPMPGENGSGIPPIPGMAPARMPIKPWRRDHHPMSGENGSGIPPTGMAPAPMSIKP
jgi:hypothetical protein